MEDQKVPLIATDSTTSATLDKEEPKLFEGKKAFADSSIFKKILF